MLTLHQYIKRTKQTYASFAEALGLKGNYLSEIANYKRTPSLLVAYKIMKATGGAFPMHHWVENNPELSRLAMQKSHRATENATIEKGDANVQG
jgi:transcriptional regulator with XRE-family HTH domain